MQYFGESMDWCDMKINLIIFHLLSLKTCQSFHSEQSYLHSLNSCSPYLVVIIILNS